MKSSHRRVSNKTKQIEKKEKKKKTWIKMGKKTNPKTIVE